MIATYPITVFLAVAYAFTWLAMLPALLAARGMIAMSLPLQWEAIAAFGPFIAAAIVLRATGGSTAVRSLWRSLHAVHAPRTAHALAILSPFAFLALALIVALSLAPAGGRLDSIVTAIAGSRLASWHGLADLVLFGALLQSLGEEPGWRGWLLPKLRERRGPLAATLLLFPAWLLWHLPQFLARPEFGVGQFAGFALGILSAAFWLTAIRESGGTVFHAIAWHALANFTRGVALAISVPAFLTYGMSVTLGAAVIAARWALRSSK